MNKSNHYPNGNLLILFILAAGYSFLVYNLSFRINTLAVAKDVTKSTIVFNIGNTGIGNTGIGTTNITPTPRLIVGKDGTWCRDLDYGNGYVAGICQDKAGNHSDYCSSNTAKEYYCQYRWNGRYYTNVKCAVGGYVCPTATRCVSGGCVRPTPTGIGPSVPQVTPTGIGPSVPQVTPTGVGGTRVPITGSDGTWCFDSDNGGYSVPNAYCQDTTGTYADYCASSTAKEYYCTYSWNGSSRTNVRCTLGGYVCPTTKVCTSGACL